ncbi:NAD(P)/FAD-dependent oxidoreductase [Aestuariivirga sp.]|uniref:NAD(P)/FAD-dependent oxidoreductase n=1 Tax=Aestuariivirga sp. TaxID=2650926 RepID=UPI0039E31784
MTPNTTIIGAGIVGTSTAAFLQKQGHQVTVIDRVGPGEGCSFGNAGGVAFAEIMPTVHPRIFRKLPGWLMDPLGPLTIRWSYLPKALPWFLAAARNTTPARVEEIVQARAALGMRVVADFETLLGDAGRKDLLVYRETLRLFDEESQFKAEAAERVTKQRLGFPCEIYTGDQVREMEPAVGKNVIRGASHGGWYFVLNPEGVVKAIAKTVVANGGKIISDDVRGIVHQDGKVTALTLASGGRHAVDNLVICAGAYSHLLARQLGEHVLLEAERGYHIVLPDPGVSISRSLTYARTPGAATPMEMGLRLAGTDEFAGLEAEPNYARADALYHVFKKVLPGLQPPNERATRWMGRRPGTPDSLPVIGRSKTMSNVVYGFGHGHMGLTWGPTTGRLVSEILANKTPNMSMEPFRVNRF